MTSQFRPLLASTENIEDSTFHKLVFPYYASPKIDGIRMLCDDIFGPITRALKDIPNNAIREYFNNPLFYRFDGEIIASYNGEGVTHPQIFNRTQSAVMSQNGEPNFTYYIFDLYPKSHDKNDYAKRPFHERLHDLRIKYEALHAAMPAIKIVLVEQKLVNNLEELIEFEEKQILLGYEGVILKSVDGVYKHGRSTTLQNIQLKMKRFADAEAVIIGWKPYMINENESTIDELGFSKRSSHKDNKRIDDTRVGVIEARVLTGPLTGERIDIGTGIGLTFEARRKLRLEIEDHIKNKTVLTFKYQDHGIKDRPRIPILKSINAERQHLATEPQPADVDQVDDDQLTLF